MSEDQVPHDRVIEQRQCARGYLLAWHDGEIGGVVLDRHDRRNAIGRETAEDLDEAVAWLRQAGVGVGVLSAAGTVFCAGADLSAEVRPGQAFPMNLMIDTLRGSGIFWISAVQGPAIGAGVALALANPVVLASETAWFYLPEVSKVGRFPLAVIDAIHPEVPLLVKIRLAVTEDRITAREGCVAGWIAAVHAPDDLDDAALAVARKLAVLQPANRDGLAQRWYEAGQRHSTWDHTKDGRQ